MTGLKFKKSVFLILALSLGFSLHKSSIYSGNGEVINSLGNALDFHDADVHTKLISRLLLLENGVSTTVNLPIAAGASTFNVSSLNGLEAGQVLTFKNQAGHELGIQVHPRVISVADLVVQLDTFIDVLIPSGSIVKVVSNDLSIADGAISSPIIFKVEPHFGSVFHVERLIFTVEDSGAMDDSLFGAGTALGNGLLIRESKADGTFRNLGLVKKNGDLRNLTFDLVYTDKAGGGNTGMGARWTFKRGGAIVKLEAGDSLQAVIADDLTGLISFKIMAQGHIESE